MPKARAKKPKYYALRYHGGERNNAVVRRQYLSWRTEQVPPLPERCDNPVCKFHTEPLSWNGLPLSLILEHANGVNTDNRPSNLRLLCPNCDSQNSSTRGGANAGRVQKSEGGFAIVERSGRRHYVLPAEPGHYELSGTEVQLTASPSHSPADGADA